MGECACICEFPPTCDGDGFLVCMGCGGDICVCAECFGNGEMTCPGCDACAPEWYDVAGAPEPELVCEHCYCDLTPGVRHDCDALGASYTP